MKKVRREDKAGIVQGVMEALNFDPGDYGVLAMLLMDRKGKYHTEHSVRVPLTEDLQ